MASVINLEQAQSLIQEYQHQNASAGGPGLLTPDQKFLNGYFIEKASILDMISNPANAGISIYFAKDPDFVGSEENVFTLVLAGVVPNVQQGSGAEPYISTGNLYIKVPPCPTTCGKLT